MPARSSRGAQMLPSVSVSRRARDGAEHFHHRIGNHNNNGRGPGRHPIKAKGLKAGSPAEPSAFKDANKYRLREKVAPYAFQLGVRLACPPR